jgi:hydrogenase nickel incorporation protein HypA/HybF
MHELKLARTVAEIAARHAEGRVVRVVSVRVGALRQVVPESLAFCFEALAAEHGLPGARLDYETVPAWLRCEECGREWDPAPPPARDAAELLPSFRCPDCGSARAAVTRGEELEVTSLEAEEAPCTARA